MSSIDTEVTADLKFADSATTKSPYQRIVVAVGGHKNEAALKYAAALAKESGAAVRVVHLREREIYRGQRFVVESTEQAEQLVDTALAELHDAGVTASSSVRVASVGREGVNIVDEALGWGADAIVLGPGPRRSWRRLFGRGVCEQVLRASTIPVIVASTSYEPLKVSDTATETKTARERHAA